jgi:hypothetical protein
MRNKVKTHLMVVVGLAILAFGIVPAHASSPAVACAVAGEVAINAPNGISISGLNPGSNIDFSVLSGPATAAKCTDGALASVGGLSASGTATVPGVPPLTTISVSSWAADDCSGTSFNGTAVGAVALLNDGSGSCNTASGPATAVATFAADPNVTRGLSVVPCGTDDACLVYAYFTGLFVVTQS